MDAFQHVQDDLQRVALSESQIMIGRMLLASLLAGLLAGLLYGGLVQWQLVPLIAQAEGFEHAEAAPHDHGAHSHGPQAAAPCVENMPGMRMCGDGAVWEPEDGLEKSFFTLLTSMIAGAGFAMIMFGLSLITALPLTRKTGVVWGLCGFLAVALAPAMGLTPQLPGMPMADHMARQIWWLGTVLATGIGIYLLVSTRRGWGIALGLMLILTPQLMGAPQPTTGETAVPAVLAANFVARSLVLAAVFWCLLGCFTGFAVDFIKTRGPRYEA